MNGDSGYIAVIDCGTNTFHLMISRVYDDGFDIISREKVAVKIGAGGINKGTILPDAEERAIKALSGFSNKIAAKNISDVRAFATSAFRNASNSESIVKRIEEETGIVINVISGDREAELIYRGVNHALQLEETTLVMDIGGGSVEFIIGKGNNVLWKKSFEIGGQRLVELFHNHDPIAAEDIHRLESYLQDELEPLFEALETHTPQLLAGSSGTFDTLSDIYRMSAGIEASAETAELPLTWEAYKAIHTELINKSKEERLKIPGMIPLRVEMIVVASCMINFLISRYSFKNVRVSTFSLKEGILAEKVGL